MDDRKFIKLKDRSSLMSARVIESERKSIYSRLENPYTRDRNSGMYRNNG